MKLEQHIVKCLGKYGIYVEHYLCDHPCGTMLLVNGALATTNAYTQTAKYLTRDLKLNVVLYDLPYAGKSREHNPGLALVGKDDEVDILCHLIDRFSADYLSSISWGGVAALLAMARGPSSVKKAVIGSFSPVLNGPMLDYIARGQALVEANDKSGAANLLNSTVGKFLPRLLKLYNYRYLTSLPDTDAPQLHFHVRQILELDANNYLESMGQIDIPVLFMNGQLDEYTTASDVHLLSKFIHNARFVTIQGAGHFLDLESKKALREVRRLGREFLLGEEDEPAEDEAVLCQDGTREIA
ncbi:MAG: alpha/beta hydrolase [Nevskia sp.]|nr:alpha/beta hydrolase [Nevskia sp.]